MVDNAGFTEDACLCDEAQRGQENLQLVVGQSDEIEQLNDNIERVLEENADLKSQIKLITNSLAELNQVEELLRKSNIALGKECERLAAENETLLLKIIERETAQVPEEKEISARPRAAKSQRAKQTKTRRGKKVK